MDIKTLVLAITAIGSIGVRAASPFVPITEGLNFDLDSSVKSSITVDGDGGVSEWRSVYGREGFAFTNPPSATSRPYYSATAFNGAKPGVVFGFDRSETTTESPSHLTANAVSTNWTVFLVFHRYASQSAAWTEGGYSTSANAKSDLLFGITGSKSGDAKRGIYCDAYSRLVNVVTGGGYTWTNGEETSDPNYPAGATSACVIYPKEGGATSSLIVQPVVFAAQVSADMVLSDSGMTGEITLAHYLWKGSTYATKCYFHGCFAEILSYDRVLTEDERNYMMVYLQEKWTGGNGPISVADGVLTARAEPGATVALGAVSSEVTTVRLLGGGTLKFLADNTIATLDVADGTVDLNGTAQTCATVIGNGAITNSAGTTASLGIASGLPSALEPYVAGDIRVTKGGAGSLTVTSRQGWTGGTELDGGTVSVVSNAAAASVPGLVLHLDARQAGTLTKNASGQVTAWESSVGGIVMRNEQTAALHAGCYPIYDSAAFDGRGGVRFGVMPDNTVTGTFLTASETITNRTVFMVVQPNATQLRVRWGIFGKWDEMKYGLGSAASQGTPLYIYDNAFPDGGWGAINGGVEYDPANETVDYIRYSALPAGSPHLVCAVSDGADTKVYAPTIGSFYLATQKYYYWQGVIGEVMVFDRALTLAERELVEMSLMAKWGIPPAWEVSPYGSASKYPALAPERKNPLTADSALAVKADSTIDFNGMEQSLSSLTLDAGEAVAYPVLTLLGSLALTDVELKLVSDGEAPGASQWLIRSAGLTGEFKSVEGGRVRYMSDGVKLAGNGGLILLLK